MFPSALTFTFTARIVRLETGLRYHILPVPEAAAMAWRAAGVRRLIGTINGHEIDRGLQHHADGGSFLVLGRLALDALGLKPGATARAELRPNPEPDALGLPEALVLALEQDDEARARWNTFTPGRQRSLAYYVSCAKREETQAKRAVELVIKIRTHTLHSDGSKPQ